jgi:hypothetical protein
MPQQITEETNLGNILFEWTFPEYEKFSRGKKWYITFGILGVLFVLYGVFTGNFLFSLIIALFGIILFLQQHQVPSEISFAITDRGIIIASRFYGYSEFESFYLIYEENGPKTLFFETGNFVQPVLRIPLTDQNPVDLRFALIEYISEDLDKKEEPMSDVAARNWKLQ